MLELRNRPKGARFAFFGLGLCVFALIPTEVGYQDIASLLARQPGVAERWQSRVFSAVGTIQRRHLQLRACRSGRLLRRLATYQLASLDNQGVDITGTVTRNPIAQPPPRYQAADFPKVDRTLKGDRLVGRARAGYGARGRRARASRTHRPPTHRCAAPKPLTRARRRSRRRSIRNLQAALSAPPLPQYDVSMSLEAQPLDDLKDAPDAAARFRLSPRRRMTAFR